MNKTMIVSVGLILLVVSVFLSVGIFSIVREVEVINTVPVIFEDGVSNNFYLEVAKGNVKGHSLVHKFGANEVVGNSWEVVSTSSDYQTPQSSQSLSVVSDSSSDGVGGVGALEITIQGLDGNFNEISEVITLNGTTPVSLDQEFIRVFRGYVSSSGSYANLSSPSHVGTITVSDGVGNDWLIIGIIDGFPSGQSEIGVYTVPAGKTGYLLSKIIIVESNKPIDVSMFTRSNADDVTVGYSGTMRLLEHLHGMDDSFFIDFISPIRIPEKTDIGFLGKTTSGTGAISVEFEMLLVDNE